MYDLQKINRYVELKQKCFESNRLMPDIKYDGGCRIIRCFLGSVDVLLEWSNEWEFHTLIDSRIRVLEDHFNKTIKQVEQISSDININPVEMVEIEG